MTKIGFDAQKLQRGIIRIRYSIIALTVIEFFYIIMIFSRGILWADTNVHDTGEITMWILSFIASGFVIWVFHVIVLITIIWFNWYRMPINRKRKKDNILMVFFLGIIGMWLWVPDIKELRKLIQEKTTHNMV